MTTAAASPVASEGKCQCGCGENTPPAPKTDNRCGWVKGRPKPFFSQPHARFPRSGWILCVGCGSRVAKGCERCLSCQHELQRAAGVDRFWERVDRTAGPWACWPWTGYVGENGYGKTSRGSGTHDFTHRIAYQSGVGRIPDGLVLDHVCHSRDLSCAGGPTCAHRRCCNPNHLEPVPHLVNVRRGRSVRRSAA